jgi:chaperone modulatory protein CbpM
MILTRQEFLVHANLDRRTLEIWIEEEWLIPRRTGSEPVFSEADLARAQLIRDLTGDLGVNPEGVGIVLHLLDQVHGLRRAMAEVLKSAHPQPGATPEALRGEKPENR